MLQILIVIFSIIPTLFGLYVAVVAIFACKKEKRYPAHEPKTRFALIIPARNEEKVLGNLIKSLKAQDYPESLFDIYVAPNNCTDHTQEVALAGGAFLLRCEGEIRSKGQVLSQAVERLMRHPAGYDAFCVFDADNVVDPGFLREMNNAACAGEKIMQGYRDTKNPYDSWVSGGYALYFKTMNLLGNRAKANAGFSASINGTGYAVCREVFEKTGGWHTVTLAEDCEFTAQSILLGQKVAWVPEAVLYDEQPVTFAQSVKQRKRWCSGIIQVAGNKLGQLIACFVKTRSATVFDCIVNTATPIFQLLGLIPGVLSVIYMIVSGMVTWQFLGTGALVLLAAYLLTVALGFVMSLYRGKWDKRMCKTIFTFGFFLISWMPIQWFAFVRRTTVWHEIQHTRSMSLEQAQGISAQDKLQENGREDGYVQAKIQEEKAASF